MFQDSEFTQCIDQFELETIIQKLASRINADYADIEGSLILVGVLKGAFLFMADLIRKIKVPTQVEFLRVSSYGNEKISSGQVTLLQDLNQDVTKRHVLIIEEIIDSGNTLKFLYQKLKAAEPASLEIVALLDKASKRQVNVCVKYVGKTVEDLFLIGYGLDLEEKCRNLPNVYCHKNKHSVI